MRQIDIALKVIQQDIGEISHRGVQTVSMESAHVLGEIIQLLIVEMTVCMNVDWTIHPTPALALFKDIFEHHGMSSSQPNLETLLGRLSPPLSAMTRNKPLPNTADQSALIFFMAILLFVDIISSTALDEPPRLQGYLLYLLSSSPTGEIPIPLDAFVGCQSWCLLAISDISALHTWKNAAKRARNLSVP